MNNPQMAGQLLPLDRIIKPGQVQGLGCLTAEQKTHYTNGITTLWKRMQDNPGPDSPERVQAHRSLSDVSNKLRASMIRWRQAQAQQGQQTAPPPQQQIQAQAIGQPVGQNPEPSQPQQAQPQQAFSERVREQARLLNVQIPGPFRGRPQEELARWVNEEKRKYASLLAVYEKKQDEVVQFRNNVQNMQQHKQFSQSEQTHLKARMAALHEQVSQARSQALAFKKTREENLDVPQQQQQQLQLQHMKMEQQQNQQELLRQQAQQSQASPTKQEEQTIPIQNTKSENDSKSEPERKQSMPIATSNVPESQAPGSAATQGPPALQTAVPPVKTFPGSAAQNSPQTAPGSAGPVKPLSREDAVQRARSWAATSQNTTTPVPTSTTQPGLQREPSTQASSNSKNLNKPIQVSSPQPVGMPAARPSLSGGANTVGQMGQPAIQKPPTFTLEGEGERVLSKKKLEDLVRQVTGGAGGEGELLDPDVEETLLDVADEFVDNVITSACRLAKIRGSSTLDLRDIQIILERNYNIRVPGFASDELRTVRKIQPTQGWTQKMSAVQAAKVTGGKNDT